MGLKQHQLRDEAKSDFGIRKLTDEEKRLQREFRKNNKVSKIIPKYSDEKVSSKFKKVLI